MLETLLLVAGYIALYFINYFLMVKATKLSEGGSITYQDRRFCMVIAAVPIAFLVAFVIMFIFGAPDKKIVKKEREQ